MKTRGRPGRSGHEGDHAQVTRRHLGAVPDEARCVHRDVLPAASKRDTRPVRSADAEHVRADKQSEETGQRTGREAEFHHPLLSLMSGKGYPGSSPGPVVKARLERTAGSAVRRHKSPSSRMIFEIVAAWWRALGPAYSAESQKRLA